MRNPTCLLAIATLTALLLRSDAAAQTSPPNIVVMMVDDLGWNHLGVPSVTMGTNEDAFYTPNLKRLADRGLSFTHAYAQPNCAPTRAAMLSGQYPARVNNQVYVVGGLNRFANKRLQKNGAISQEQAKFRGPQQSQDVAAEAITVAEAMQKNGYATAHIGKYHVGGHDGPETMPENVGFDINIGGFSQGHQPVCFASKNQSGKWKFNGLGLGHFDRFGAPYDVTYVKDHGLDSSLVGTAKHVGDAIGDAVEETVGKLHATGKPFYMQFHTYAVHGPVISRPDLKVAAVNRVGKKSKRPAEYLGFISSIDENVARLERTLNDPNGDGDASDSIVDNTLILFTSDNGGTHGDNLPLKGQKGMLTEGGIRVPLIAYWPGVVPAGTATDHLVHAVDYYPTCLELAGSKWSPSESEHPLDGKSFASVLRDPSARSDRGPIFYLFPGYLDVRATPSVVAIDDIGDKRYKLMYTYETDSWELYCLSDDIGEAKNLVEDEPEVASQLSKSINEWLTQKHPTWKPAMPIDKATGKPAGPPSTL